MDIFEQSVFRLMRSCESRYQFIHSLRELAEDYALDFVEKDNGVFLLDYDVLYSVCFEPSAIRLSRRDGGLFLSVVRCI